MRKIAGYLTKNRSEKDQKSPKAHTKTDTSSQEKLFGEIIVNQKWIAKNPLILSIEHRGTEARRNKGKDHRARLLLCELCSLKK